MNRENSKESAENQEKPREPQGKNWYSRIKTQLPKEDLEHIDRLQEQLEKLQAEKDEIFARLQRVSADYINYQKRSAKQITESIDYEKELIIKSLLPVLDNFEHTLNAAENNADVEGLRKGVKIIYEQILSILKNYGIEQVSSVGKPFDPAYHQAVMQEIAEDKEDGIILKELVKCYKIGDKVLRPGRVVVNKKAAGMQEEDDNGSDEDRE